MEEGKKCVECDSEVICTDEDDAPESPFGSNFICAECGAELTEAAIKFKNYKLGKVQEVEESKNLKVTKIVLKEGGEPL